jgi:hypothetical protein
MDPDVYQAFMNSTNCTYSKGTGVNLLKVGTKR